MEFLGAKASRIRGTNRVIDGEVTPDMFVQEPQFSVFGDVGDPATKESLQTFFGELPEQKECVLPRIEPPEIPEPQVTRYPSNPRGHTIVRATPMEAYAELIFRLYRFGHRNMVAKKTGLEGRVELQNVKVVIEEAREESDEVLRGYGFLLEKFKAYQCRILDPGKPYDLGYTYGNRLRQHFGSDSLEIVAKRLREKPDSRHAYFTLWDNTRDLIEGTDTPCFVTAFFRRFEGRLTLTATFRSHNAMEAWPENVYGLIAIQRFVANLANMEPGAITVVSHSISIDLPSLEKAKRIATSKESDEVYDPATGKHGPRMDPHGEFTMTIDRDTWEIVLQHSYKGMPLTEYRGKTAEEIERKLARDVAISEISHALYIGRELARKQEEMKRALANSKK